MFSHGWVKYTADGCESIAVMLLVAALWNAL